MESPQPPGSPDPPQPASEPDAPPPSARVPAEVPAELADYPVQADIQRQEEYARWMPLVKWLLAFPHYIVLLFLAIGAFFAGVAAFFAVIFTRRYPRGLFDYMVGVLRYGLRVSAYVLLMTDRYPPFSLEDDPDYPARLEIAYPEEIDRWRPLVQWILAIPVLIVANILQNLAHILVFFAFFTILFTRNFPDGMFKIVVVAVRWQLRAIAYAYFLTTRYPPFVWG